MFLWFFNKPAGEPEQEVREEQTQTHGSSRITETRHTLSSSLCDSSSAKANAFQGKSPTQCRRKEAARTRRVTSLIAYSLIRRGILHIKTSHRYIKHTPDRDRVERSEFYQSRKYSIITFLREAHHLHVYKIHSFISIKGRRNNKAVVSRSREIDRKEAVTDRRTLK